MKANAFNKQVDVVTKSVVLQQQNELAIEVRSQPGTSLLVTILEAGEPPPSPVSGITATPDGFPINTPTQVTFTAAVPYQPGGPVPTVELEQVSLGGNVIAVEGAMVDDGQLSLGDEISGDGVFSFRKTYTIPQPSDVLLRAKVDLNGQVFYSDIFTLTAFTPISDNEANAINGAQTSAVQLYYDHLSTKGKDQALADVVAFLKGQAFVQDAGVSVTGESIWIKYKNGMDGVLALHPPGTRGGPQLSALSQQGSVAPANIVTSAAQAGDIEVQSKKVLILSPFLDEFGATDEGTALKTIYDNHNSTVGCPLYDVVYLANSQVGVGSFKALGSYGIVHVSSHGTVGSNNQVVIFTKTSASTQNLQTYQADIQKGRLITGSTTTGTWLGATPAFFSYYIKTMPSSLVFFSSCFSTFNSTLGDVIRAKGAKSYLGFSNSVPSNFAYSKATYFHQNWAEDPTTLITTGQVFNGGCSSGACWTLFGANNLEAPSGGLQNGGFESGVLDAWTAAGDGRVLSQLGQFSPIEGSFLGLVSTGLGFTTTSGSIEQKICLPTNAQKLEFHWNFNSEEFVEWCGSGFQDTFRVDMVTSAGTQNLFSRKVDDLCGTVSPSNLKFDQSQGACTPSSGVGFGTGGNDCTVWTTGWQSQSIDITGIATANQNKAVTLRFSAGDVGDSIFDSAVLLDDIKVTTP